MRACGVGAEGLHHTVAAFNAPARRGEDPEFQRGSDAYQRFNGASGHAPNPCLAPLETPRFYAVRVVPGALGTFAGIATNADAQVVDNDDLYAVGNDVASVMGDVSRSRHHHRASHDLRLHRRAALGRAVEPAPTKVEYAPLKACPLGDFGVRNSPNPEPRRFYAASLTVLI